MSDPDEPGPTRKGKARMHFITRARARMLILVGHGLKRMSSSLLWGMNIAASDSLQSRCLRYLASRACRWGLLLLVLGPALRAHGATGWSLAVIVLMVEQDMHPHLPPTPDCRSSRSQYVLLVRYIGSWMLSAYWMWLLMGLTVPGNASLTMVCYWVSFAIYVDMRSWLWRTGLGERQDGLAIIKAAACSGNAIVLYILLRHTAFSGWLVALSIFVSLGVLLLAWPVHRWVVAWLDRLVHRHDVPDQCHPPTQPADAKQEQEVRML